MGDWDLPSTPISTRQSRSTRLVPNVVTSGEPVTPELRGWDNRNPGPVYGAPWPQPPLFRDSDRGLWSLPRPPDPLVGRALSPRAAEGTATRGRLWGPSAITCSPHVPAPTKDLGRGGASSPGQGKEGFLSSIVKPPVPAKSGRFHGSSAGLWPGEGKVHQNRFFKLPMRVKSGRNGRTSLTSKARNSGAGELRPPRARLRASPHRTGPSSPVPVALRSLINGYCAHPMPHGGPTEREPRATRTL